ncbi:hypothetical protein OSB04_020945 [Centaurea solstitialis]|uniref:Uncharacterized protein n=1 Tax=Centaurea solstitialis TaxID=347529 RepID=A0AA38W6C6_9ASTR|nr:hypothetical protein OSB04_020945 [Centaurea solstitialis]
MWTQIDANVNNGVIGNVRRVIVFDRSHLGIDGFPIALDECYVMMKNVGLTTLLKVFKKTHGESPLDFSKIIWTLLNWYESLDRNIQYFDLVNLHSSHRISLRGSLTKHGTHCALEQILLLDGSSKRLKNMIEILKHLAHKAV